MTDQQTTSAIFTHSEVMIIKQGLMMFDDTSRGWEDKVITVLGKLRPGIPPLARVDKIAAEKIEQLEAEIEQLRNDFTVIQFPEECHKEQVDDVRERVRKAGGMLSFIDGSRGRDRDDYFKRGSK